MFGKWSDVLTAFSSFNRCCRHLKISGAMSAISGETLRALVLSLPRLQEIVFSSCVFPVDVDFITLTGLLGLRKLTFKGCIIHTTSVQSFCNKSDNNVTVRVLAEDSQGM